MKDTAKRATNAGGTSVPPISRSIFSHQDTPPPISIDDGSFSIRIDTPTTVAGSPSPLPESGSGSPWYYHGKVNGAKKNSIEHIKVLHGSGEVVYRDNAALGSVIVVDLRDEQDNQVGRLTFSHDAQNDEFQITSQKYGAATQGDGKLPYHAPAGPGSHANRHRWSHKGGDNPNREFRVSSIEIIKPAGTVFKVALPLLAGAPLQSHEYRVLVWLYD